MSFALGSISWWGSSVDIQGIGTIGAVSPALLGFTELFSCGGFDFCFSSVAAASWAASSLSVGYCKEDKSQKYDNDCTVTAQFVK